MPKLATPRSDVQVRASMRTNEKRKLMHAVDTLIVLLEKHNLGEREVADLHILKSKLFHAINNQHIVDKAYAEYRKERELPEGF